MKQAVIAFFNLQRPRLIGAKKVLLDTIHVGRATTLEDIGLPGMLISTLAACFVAIRIFCHPEITL